MSTTVNPADKTNILRKEFLEIEVNHDELLSIEQFYIYLDKKLKKKFDRELGDQLFQRMNKGFNNKVTVDDFIKVFLQAEEILKNKIESCKKQILEYNKQRKYTANQFDSIKDSERVNQYGIKEDSVLTVELVEGADFPAQNVQVIVKLENQKQELKQQHGPNPQWNNTMQFNISTGLEELQLFFYTINHPNIPELLGTVTLSLSHLTNQIKVEDTCQLFNKNGKQTKSVIKLRSQWVYSEAKSLGQQIEVWNEQINRAQEDLLDFEKDIAMLYEPFPNYVQIIRNQKNDDLAINRQPPNTLVMTPINNVDLQYNYKLYTRLSILINMGIDVFICFGKCQFLDLIFCFLFIIDFEKNQLFRKRIIYYTICFGLSLIFDLLWAAKYSRGFWGQEDTITDKYFAIERGPNRLALILLYIQFVFKLILCVLLGALSQQTPEEQQNEQLPQRQRSQKQQQFNQTKTAQFGEDNSTFYNY